MLKFCVYQWDLNKDLLLAHIERDKRLNSCNYDYLVRLVVRYILNGEYRHPELKYWGWSEEVHEIDDCCYQGVKLFVIPRDCVTDKGDYLIASVNYGSCSVCDTLNSIQCELGGVDDDIPTESQVKDYMELCKDIVCSIVHPFAHYWGETEAWQHMTINDMEVNE